MNICAMNFLQIILCLTQNKFKNNLKKILSNGGVHYIHINREEVMIAFNFVVMDFDADQPSDRSGTKLNNSHITCGGL